MIHIVLPLIVPYGTLSAIRASSLALTGAAVDVMHVVHAVGAMLEGRVFVRVIGQ